MGIEWGLSENGVGIAWESSANGVGMEWESSENGVMRMMMLMMHMMMLMMLMNPAISVQTVSNAQKSCVTSTAPPTHVIKQQNGGDAMNKSMKKDQQSIQN